MAEFPETRRRLARLRRIFEIVLVTEAFLLGVSMVGLWLWMRDKTWLFLAIVISGLMFLGILAGRRHLRPEDDLRRTIRRLNAKKKWYRKRGIRVRFSSRWFPFGEFGAPANRRFRFAVIPATLSFLLCGLFAVATVAWALQAKEVMEKERTTPLRFSAVTGLILTSLLAAVVLNAIAGRKWMSRRYGVAAIANVASFAIVAAAAIISEGIVNPPL